MKNIILLATIFASFNALAAVYKAEDKAMGCTRYMSQDSQYLDAKEAELADQKLSDVLTRVSIMPAVNFSRRDGKFTLKGSWGLYPLVMDVNIGEFEADYILGNNFKSVCVEGKEVVELEHNRKLFNNLNDYDQ